MEMTPTNQYTLLRVALDMFGKAPVELDAPDYQQVLQQANKELAIGRRVLSSAEAKAVIVPEAVLQQAFASLAGRYDSEEDFLEDLERNGLTRDTLLDALRHELSVDAVIERVVARVPPISEQDLEIYYYQHIDKFTLPETRTARHILITINDDYRENRHDIARHRIEGLLHQLRARSQAFTSLAKAHSECPTAMHDGLLGRIKPGQLFDALDAALFSMAEGEISEILESPVGLHILMCEQIHPSERRSFAEVKEKLRQHLEEKLRKQQLRDWLKGA